MGERVQGRGYEKSAHQAASLCSHQRHQRGASKRRRHVSLNVGSFARAFWPESFYQRQFMLPLARSPEPGECLGAEVVRAASIRKPLLRIGGRVVTQDGFFAKIVGLSGQDPLLLDLEVVGIGLRAGVPVSQVTTSDRRSVPLSPRKRRSLSPAGVPRWTPATTGRRPGKSRAASAAAHRLSEACGALLEPGPRPVRELHRAGGRAGRHHSECQQHEASKGAGSDGNMLLR